MYGIVHVKAVLEKLGDLACDAIDLGKHGIGISAIGDICRILKDAKDLVIELPQAMPELTDLSADESSELAGLAYHVVKRMADKFAA